MEIPELQETDEGVLLPVQAQPRARKNVIAGWHAGRLKVSVTQAPEKGKANQALIKLLAKSLGIKRGQIRLVTGETSTQKVFCISEHAPAEVLSRIAAAIEEA